jgi:hypothetical protein
MNMINFSCLCGMVVYKVEKSIVFGTSFGNLFERGIIVIFI